MRLKSRWVSLLVLVSLGALGCSAGSSGTGTADPPGPPRLTIFYTSELKGTIEPCGCTTDPLGDLARTAQLIASARSGGAILYVDGGSMLYTHNPIAPDFAEQEDMKAKLLLDVFGDKLEPAGVGLGPFDLSRGPAAVKPPRLASNVPASAGIALAEPHIVEAGGVKVGLFGVVSPAALEPLGIHATPPAAAATQAITKLRKDGAKLIVGIAHMTKGEARTLAREAPGADVLLVGQNLPDDPKKVSRGPSRVGDTWLMAPADRGQVVTRLDLTLRGSGHLADAIGEARAKEEIVSLEAQVETLTANIERWQADAKTDTGFLTQKKSELDELRKSREKLQKTPLQVPASGPYFVMEQVRIRKALPCDSSVVAAKSVFDRDSSAANLAAAKSMQPPVPGKGEPAYVGTEECSFCHDKEVAFWKKTKHAQAWKTLTDVGKEYNRDCIYCHVTGFGKPGGSNLGFNESLRDVQCETCHGPGSLHVEADGNDEPSTIVRAPEERVCAECHSHEHSDTFQFEAYLRDVTGPGHGDQLRKKLGDGPTGKELRAAGLLKAGKSIGKGCPK